MTFKLTGRITNITETISGTSKEGKEWKKLTFVIDTFSEYNNVIAFDVFGVEKVDNFIKYHQEGKMVDVEFNIKSNLWKDKYYTSLDAWKVTTNNNTNEKMQKAEATINAVFPPADDDLPF